MLSVSTIVDPKVRAAYEAAHYCIEPADAAAVVMRVAEKSAGLAALYVALNASSCGFLTACNPLGKVCSDDYNSSAMAALTADVEALGLVMLPGTGRDADPGSDWPGEHSLSVFGISREAACELGSKYGQNAILWAGADATPELVMLR